MVDAASFFVILNVVEELDKKDTLPAAARQRKTYYLASGLQETSKLISKKNPSR